MSEQPFAVAPVLGLLAATPAAGFALINGTPNILTWTAPNDGQYHRVMVFGAIDCTSVATGGSTGLSFTNPDGSAGVPGLSAASPAQGSTAGFIQARVVKAGTLVAVQQTAALTAGAVLFFAELWGS